MAYINVENVVNNVKYFLTIIMLSLLVACGSAPIDDNKPVVYEPSAAVETSTLIYIPKLKVDSKGQLVAYKAETNPYLRRQGSVRGDSVEAFIQAKRAFKANNLDQAQLILEELTASNKRLSGPWVMLGDVILQRNELDEDTLNTAEQHYSKAILINKYNVNAYLRLAKVKRMQGDFSKAKSTYADVLALWKDFPEAHLNLGILYDIYLNDDVKAQKHIEAYQFLTEGENTEVAQWLLEIQGRTGMATELNVQKQNIPNKPIS
ncbi:MAG: tetratricopeptide repeat protein [Cellvibrionaceae bacterium]